MAINDQKRALCARISQVRRGVQLSVYHSNGFPLLSAGFSLTMGSRLEEVIKRELSDSLSILRKLLKVWHRCFMGRGLVECPEPQNTSMLFLIL